MIRSIPRFERTAMEIGVLVAFLLLLLRVVGDGLLEMGDGLNHYMIARYSWKHPELLMDIWGKPLFTLLASPFAQMGHVGVAVFNAVVAAATAWFGVRALRSGGGVAQLAFPLLVLLSPQYVLMVMAGMTEPLFGLVTVLTIMLLLDERHVAAAVVASLAPLSRPEYIVFLPCVALWLVFARRWRALPWCALGLVVYAVATTVTKGEPLWFWVGDPYSWADGAYGSGPLDYFLKRAETIYGRPLLTLGLVALVLWPLVYWRDIEHRRELRLILVCAALPVLGMFAVHSVLWYTGWRGSAGLVRVLVTSVPLAGLFTLLTLGHGARLLLEHRWTSVIPAGIALSALATWVVIDLTAQVELPITPSMNQRFLDAASHAVQQHYRPGLRVYSTHPYMAFRADIDPFDTATYNPIWGLSDEDVDRRFRPGDLLVWDAQLGSNEAGIPLDRMLNDGRFAVLGAFEPPEGTRVLGNHVYEIFLFERRDVVRSFSIDTVFHAGQAREVPDMRVDTVACDDRSPGRWCLKEGEFPLELRQLPLPEEGSLYDEWIVTGQATVEDGSRLAIVFSQRVNEQGVRYDQEDVNGGAFEFSRRVPPTAPGTEQVIYFWNIGQRPFKVDGFTVVRKRWTQRPA